MATPLKLFYASDIHGSERCFLKFLSAAKYYRAQVLILGGDITGKVVVPLVRHGSDYHTQFLGREWRVSAGRELEELEKAVRMNGCYPVRLTPEEHQRYLADDQAREGLVAGVIRASLTHWLELAEERLAGSGIRCLINPGNDDDWYVDEVLQQSQYVENGDGQVLDLDEDHQMITVGYSNRTPFNSPRELDEEKLGEQLMGLAARLARPESAVFTIHVPPYRSGLDDAPQLRDLKVVTRGGQPVMVPVGSTAVREAISAVGPLLALHGHVHESRGAKRMGRTLCINPGSEYSEGVLRGALIALGRDRIMGYQLVSA